MGKSIPGAWNLVVSTTSSYPETWNCAPGEDSMLPYKYIPSARQVYNKSN